MFHFSFQADVTKLPKYFQMGTVVDSAVDFYGGRLSNSERKSSLTEQLLADQQLTQASKLFQSVTMGISPYDRVMSGGGFG